MAVPVYWTRAGNVTWGCNNNDGCQSEACQNCYALDQHRRFGKMKAYPDVYHHPFGEIQIRPKVLSNEMRRGSGEVIFVCNMSDLFHGDIPFDYIDRVFCTMAEYPEHTYLVLTKRARRMKEFVEWHLDKWEAAPEDFKEKFGHVWMGVTAENQARADERIPYLLMVPAKNRFISVEPFIGPIDLSGNNSPSVRGKYCDKYCLDVPGQAERDYKCAIECSDWAAKDDTIPWCPMYDPLDHIDLVIAGGESSLNGIVRTMNPEWARSLKEQCTAARTKFYFKQYGTGYCRENRMTDNQVFDGVDYSKLSPKDIWKVTS